jgi:hypothetical protein
MKKILLVYLAVLLVTAMSCQSGVFLERIDQGEITLNLDLYWGLVSLPIISMRLDGGEVIVHLDAFDERNEGALYYVQGLFFREIGQLS